jgi:hypothetical protein
VEIERSHLPNRVLPSSLFTVSTAHSEIRIELNARTNKELLIKNQDMKIARERTVILTDSSTRHTLIIYQVDR